ncbi:MAG TPA: hypothetical protein VFU30_04200 [Gaiellaceae bacterium]|nr:hypothetical protein [Gaiellaceae bacterium]
MARDARLLAGLFLAIAAGLLLAGSTSAASSSSTKPLVEHWDGSSWTEVASPTTEWLEAVAAASPDDVWTFGYSPSHTPAAGHWDGSAWKRVPLPSPKGAQAVELVGAAARAVDDVWAVGSWEAPRAPLLRPLVEHWNGTSWSIWPTPSFKVYGRLLGVTALSPTNAWAVGAAGVRAGKRITLRTLVLHWNGHEWTRVPSPNPRTASTSAAEIQDAVTSVAAVSPQDMWAVGAYFFRSAKHHTDHTLALHWNGRRWLTVPSPSPGGPAKPSVLTGVTAAAGEVWAVGRYSFRKKQLALFERWDGARWRVVASPGTPGPKDRRDAFAAASLAPDDVWAVGMDGSGTNTQPLVERWDGSAWSVVPVSPTPTDDSFAAVAVLSSTDVWAVGTRFQP